MPSSHTETSLFGQPRSSTLAGPTSRATVSARILGPTLAFRFSFGGKGRIDGTVKKTAMPSNLPAAALVRLYRDKDGLLVDATHSDPATGAYSFTLLDMTYTYTALAYDTSTAVYRAVAGDRLTPIPM